MCVVSLVMTGWTDPNSPNYMPLSPPKEYLKPWMLTPAPPPPTQSDKTVTPDIAKQMLEVIERLDKLDKTMGFKDCAVEKEHKQVFLSKLQKLIDDERSEDILDRLIDAKAGIFK